MSLCGANPELYFNTCKLIEAKLGYFNPSLFSVDYNSIYSAMTQVTGALIVLMAIFIVYRLEVQRNRISKCSEALKDAARDYSDSAKSPGPYHADIQKIVTGAEIALDKKADARTVKLCYFSLKRLLADYSYTARRGIVSVLILAFLFLFYITGLYVHPMLAFPQLYFFGTLLTSLIVVPLISWFIYIALRSEQEEYGVIFKKDLKFSKNEIQNEQ